jgi:hypothetical protein
MKVKVTTHGRNYVYDLIDDNDNIIDQRISLKRYNACTKDGRKYYVDLNNVKPKDINRLIHINNEGID